MRHGDLFAAQGERRGLVLVRTPYDARCHHDLARSLAARGLDCLVQDVRGRHRAAGSWVPYRHEAEDGAATLRDLASAGIPGPYLLYGASYEAHAALEAARTVPHLVSGVLAAVPALGLHETAWSRAGVPRHRDRIGWWTIHGFARTDEPALPPRRLAAATAVAEQDGPLAVPDFLGWPEERRAAWARLWAAEPVDLGRYAGLPLLVVTGDTDPFDDHARALAAATGADLLSGPWGHDLGIGTDSSPGPRMLAWLRDRTEAPA
ncbi:CocE/NonD family hydrolase [Nocardioides sp. LML1-1-1.1]|uniref:CocE/NonD family hydrolase n=1 Tax=Nocardioides sp. LML1-1-1.1 TaxID=3135248 RepID=UPI00343B1D90